jgi:hypothetical protein
MVYTSKDIHAMMFWKTEWEIHDETHIFCLELERTHPSFVVAFPPSRKTREHQPQPGPLLSISQPWSVGHSITSNHSPGQC